MTQPDLNPTLEAFKAKMLEKHESTLRASMELVRISNGILYEPIAEPVVRKYSTLPENRRDVHSSGIVGRRRARYGKLPHAETIVLAQGVHHRRPRAR